MAVRGTADLAGHLGAHEDHVAVGDAYIDEAGDVAPGDLEIGVGRRGHQRRAGFRAPFSSVKRTASEVEDDVS